ncbi:MAG: class I SAM-dependent methyltransferase [Pirellulaceae bacterium]|nr:class I SAM-dependent methyltransferase [Pirellulaceae bacterium]
MLLPWSPQEYQLIDFGSGRKLERFGSVVLNRPSPAALGCRPACPSQWLLANVILDQSGTSNRSAGAEQLPDDWRVHFDGVTFQLRLTPYGHVGLFPEHAAQWQWLIDYGSRLAPAQPKRLLNLFAYTGAATLVLARHQWQVTHVDSSAPAVAWARHNALLSGLQSAPVRWLIEDARRFAARELRRGRQYDAILLDPPTYGHGPQGKAWQIERDLPELLEICSQLLAAEGALIVTGHSDPPSTTALQIEQLRKQFGHLQTRNQFGRTQLIDLQQRELDFGWFVRSWATHGTYFVA